MVVSRLIIVVAADSNGTVGPLTHLVELGVSVVARRRVGVVPADVPQLVLDQQRVIWLLDRRRQLELPAGGAASTTIGDHGGVDQQPDSLAGAAGAGQQEQKQRGGC